MTMRLSLILLILVLLSSGVAVRLWSDFDQPGHEFKGQCDSCHLTRPQRDEPGRFVRSLSQLCLNCHNVSLENSHPVGFVPTMALPEQFPLDWNGAMTCVTCHDPHSSARNQYLRTTARGSDFCRLCHQTVLPMQDPHIGTVGIAHAKQGIYNTDRLGDILDEVSLECLGCHDGVIASDTSYSLPGTQRFVTYERQSLSHPIGIDYRRAAMKDLELRAPESLSPYITLYDGKVGCASCHNPYSSEHRMLTMSNRGSALCLECHIK